MNSQVVKRFALFLRVSSKGQEKGESLIVQRKLGREYVEKCKGRIVEIYEGVESGTKPLEERELLQRVLRAAHTRSWDALWVLDQSRLTRSPDTLVAIATAFRVAQVELHTSSGRIPLDTPEGELQAGFQSHTDRYAAQKITQRTRQSRLELLRQGKHAFGRHPWGRHWDKDLETWVIDDASQKLIKRAYTLYIEHDLSIADVAKKLGRPKSSLAKAFASACLTEWPRKLSTPEGTHTFTLRIPALLTPAEGLAIARRRQRNLTIRPGTKRNRALLQGLIRCWHCHGKLSRMPSRKGARDYPVYRHLPATKQEKCLWQIPAQLIETDIVRACAKILGDSKQLTSAIAAAMATENVALKKARSRLKELQEAKEDAERRLERVNEELLNLSGAEAASAKLRAELARLSEVIRDISVELRDVTDQIASLDVPVGNPKHITDRLRRLVGMRGAASVTMSDEQRRKLVVLVIGRDKEASPNGVFVRMSRIRGPRTGVWYWELRGALAIIEGDSSYYAEEVSGPAIRQRGEPDLGAIKTLAELTQSLKPLYEKPLRGSKRISGVESSLSSS